MQNLFPVSLSGHPSNEMEICHLILHKQTIVAGFLKDVNRYMQQNCLISENSVIMKMILLQNQTHPCPMTLWTSFQMKILEEQSNEGSLLNNVHVNQLSATSGSD